MSEARDHLQRAMGIVTARSKGFTDQEATRTFVQVIAAELEEVEDPAFIVSALADIAVMGLTVAAAATKRPLEELLPLVGQMIAEVEPDAPR